MKNIFNYKFFFTCTAVILVAAFSFSLANSENTIEENAQGSSQHPISDTAKTNEQTASDTGEYDYLIKSHEGKIAVFLFESSKPEIVFDVYVHYLPEMDRHLLEEGIPIKDYQTLLIAIEDLVS